MYFLCIVVVVPKNGAHLEWGEGIPVAELAGLLCALAGSVPWDESLQISSSSMTSMSSIEFHDTPQISATSATSVWTVLKMSWRCLERVRNGEGERRLRGRGLRPAARWLLGGHRRSDFVGAQGLGTREDLGCGEGDDCYDMLWHAMTKMDDKVIKNGSNRWWKDDLICGNSGKIMMIMGLLGCFEKMTDTTRFWQISSCKNSSNFWWKQT